MTPAALRKHCLSLPGAELSVQWGDAQVFKVAGRMFTICDAGYTKISFKCSDQSFLILTETGAAITVPYLARARWVRIGPWSLPAAELKNRIIHSGLTRKVQASLLPFGD